MLMWRHTSLKYVYLYVYYYTYTYIYTYERSRIDIWSSSSSSSSHTRGAEDGRGRACARNRTGRRPRGDDRVRVMYAHLRRGRGGGSLHPLVRPRAPDPVREKSTAAVEPADVCENNSFIYDGRSNPSVSRVHVEKRSEIIRTNYL